jgi:hypothetical protein
MRNISIPEPCQQQWQNMTETNGGRHCSACNKTVIDFTTMSNQQIIEILSASNNTCGRLEEWQVRSVNLKLREQYQPLFNWTRITAAASLLFMLPVVGAYAQHKTIRKKQVHHVQPKSAKAISYRTISGVIRDSVNNSTLPGVVILVKGTHINSVTDMDGKYIIKVPEYADTLLTNYTGYTNQNITIPRDSDCVDIALAECAHPRIIGYGTHTVTTLTGAISVITYKKTPFYKRWYYRFIKMPAKKIFG